VFSEEPRELWSRVLRRQPPPLNLVATYPPDPSLN
jgi:putative transcriptional regulator